MRLKLFLISLGLSFAVLAQNPRGGQRGTPGGGQFNQDQMPPNFTGQVVDAKSSEIIEFATVSIFNATDSSLVTGTITDTNGKFELRVRPGAYYAKIEFLSYEDKIVSGISVGRGEPVRLGKVGMDLSSQQLEEITVQAERTQMELRLDKKVFNIGKDLSNLGGSATDILDNLPSVQVDVEGNVTLRGSDNVRILIDGKPSGLVGLSSNDALRQLNSNLIERVEIITNPSARYDAEGEAGIINIVLKKEKAKGVNGSFQFNTGVPHNHRTSINLNFRKDWVNFFTNFGIGYRKNPGRGESYQEFGDPVSRTTDRIRRHERGGLNYNTRFGADFYLNPQNSITLSFLYRFSDEDNSSKLKYFDYYVAAQSDSVTTRIGDEIEDDHNLEYAINYTKTFNKKDQKLTFDFQYQDNNEVEGSDLVEATGASPEMVVPYLYQRSENDEGEKRVMLQGDYNHPFNEKGMIEAGFRYTDRLVRNDYTVEEQDENGDYQIDLNFSNDFEYEEKVTAAYAIVNNEFGKISWQLGLRYEITDLITELKTTNDRNEQHYNNFFPSTFLTYQLTEEHAIQASYSRRIRRPRGRFLNPFFSISDNRNFFSGNPKLQPVFTDSYELGYLFNARRSTFYGGMYYRHSDGVFQRIRITIDGITYTQPYNITERDDFGLEFNIAHEFTKWYRVNTNLNFFNSTTQAGSITFNEVVTDFDEVSTTTFSGRMSNNFKLGGAITGQVNVMYRAPQKTVQGKRLSMASIDIGLARDVLKGNGTISFNVRDLLNSRKYRGETFNPGFYEESEFQWRSRTTQLSFTYRLNQKKQRQRNRRGGEDGEFDEGEMNFSG